MLEKIKLDKKGKSLKKKIWNLFWSSLILFFALILFALSLVATQILSMINASSTGSFIINYEIFMELFVRYYIFAVILLFVLIGLIAVKKRIIKKPEDVSIE